MPLSPDENTVPQMLTLEKTAFTFAMVLAFTEGLICSGLAQTDLEPIYPSGKTQLREFSDTAKTALSRQLSRAVTRGDTPGVVALVVGRDGVLYRGRSRQARRCAQHSDARECHFFDRVHDQAGDVGGDHDAVRRGQAQARRSGVEIPDEALTTCGSLRSSTRRTQPTKRGRRSGR